MLELLLYLSGEAPHRLPQGLLGRVRDRVVAGLDASEDELKGCARHGATYRPTRRHGSTRSWCSGKLVNLIISV
jgi:hypothetical protein